MALRQGAGDDPRGAAGRLGSWVDSARGRDYADGIEHETKSFPEDCIGGGGCRCARTNASAEEGRDYFLPDDLDREGLV